MKFKGYLMLLRYFKGPSVIYYKITTLADCRNKLLYTVETKIC